MSAAARITIGEQSVNVRGLGVVSSLEDIRNIVLTQQGGVPVLLVRHRKGCRSASSRGSACRGATTVTDTVTGIVLMQKLERTMDVVQRVRAAVEKINATARLPQGVQIVPFYDRGDLVAITVETVMHNLLFGIALIFLIQWVFLGNLRCALIVAATIPVALLLAVMITVAARRVRQPAVGRRHRSRHHRRRHGDHGGEHLPPSGSLRSARIDAAGAASTATALNEFLHAAVEVDRPIFFSVIITIAAFLPLFTMQGVEGQIFSPMARTYAYALLGAVIATFTVTPVMASILLPAEGAARSRRFWCGGLRAVYQTILPLAVGNARIAAIGRGGFPDRHAASLGTRLGTEFLPKLEEGNMWIRATMPPTIALEAGIDTVARIRNIIKSYPPVRTVCRSRGAATRGSIRTAHSWPSSSFR